MGHSKDLSMESANELLENLHHTQQKILFSHQETFKIPESSISPILQKVCLDISKLMNCERVEIWLFNEERTQLTLKTFYDSRGCFEMDTEVISKEKFPGYFESIVDKRTFAVENISINPTMNALYKQLSDDYQGLSSMLDASIVLSWGFGGVLCCLSEEERQWKPIEKHVLASVADILALTLDRFHRTKIEQHIYDLAYTDPLTQLNNQHSFNKKVSEELKNISKGQQGIFIYMMLDQYREIQGVLGHDASEQVIQTIAKRLLSSFPDPSIIGRIGFDHFVIFSPILMTKDQARKNMKLISKELSKPMNIVGQEVYTTFSFGYSYYPKQVSNVKDGLKAAQIALMDALENNPRKAQGVYQPVLLDSIKDNLLSEMNLRKGLDEKQFELYYQPQLTCENGLVYGFEALIRWNHPTQGVISPGHFIPLAESTGLIISIERRVIRESCEQLARWKTKGFGHLTLSINISPKHFLDESFPIHLNKCVLQSKVSPRNLILEITENVDFEHLEIVKKRIIELNEMGFSISIDDFGTGYSAFVYLQHLPIQEIKIDQQFIRNLHTNDTSVSLVKTIIQLGKMLGLKTVAEGVETLDEWNTLKQIGCDDVQGFYFGRPLPVDQINDLLDSVLPNTNLQLPLTY